MLSNSPPRLELADDCHNRSIRHALQPGWRMRRVGSYQVNCHVTLHGAQADISRPR